MQPNSIEIPLDLQADSSIEQSQVTKLGHWSKRKTFYMHENIAMKNPICIIKYISGHLALSCLSKHFTI